MIKKIVLIALALIPSFAFSQSVTRFGGSPVILNSSDSLNHNIFYFFDLGYRDEIDFKFSSGNKKIITNSERSFKLSCKQTGSYRYSCNGTGIDTKTQCPIRVSATYYKYSRAKTNSLTYTIKGNCSPSYAYQVKLWVVGSSY